MSLESVISSELLIGSEFEVLIEMFKATGKAPAVLLETDTDIERVPGVIKPVMLNRL